MNLSWRQAEGLDYFYKFSMLTGVFHNLKQALFQAGILKPVLWSHATSRPVLHLYAGTLNSKLPQARSHIGLDPFRWSRFSIRHDVTEKMPITANSVDSYQAEDVFEHIEYSKILGIFNEIFRVLKPGGLFRFSVPDYRCNILDSRSRKDAQNKIIFDPEGGGRFENGKVVDGGHLWFPLIENVQALFEASEFSKKGRIEYLHYFDSNGQPIARPIDYSKGWIQRTPDNDSRVKTPYRPMSIVVDAYKN